MRRNVEISWVVRKTIVDQSISKPVKSYQKEVFSSDGIMLNERQNTERMRQRCTMMQCFQVTWQPAVWGFLSIFCFEMIFFNNEFLRLLLLVEASSTVLALTEADASLICLKWGECLPSCVIIRQDHHYQLMNEVCRNIFFVPLGNFLNDHLSFINSACWQEPARGLWDEPPDGHQEGD